MQKIANKFEVGLDFVQSSLDGRAGFHSKGITKRLLKKLDEIDPDVVHLHVLLGYYVNVELLFNWLKNHRCKVVWTLHDCWSFTGHCIYFTYVKCEQWKKGCAKCDRCPQTLTYPWALYKGNVARNYDKKKELFTSIPKERMSLIVPSQWLSDLVKQSYMAKYDVEVRHNSVNREIFKPTPSNFRERYGIGNRFMILGVASSWSKRKGLDDFVQLAKDLDSERYAIVLVGLNKFQACKLSKKIVTISRTNSQQELAEIYSQADLFVTPSVEETYGMTVAEAQACGAHVAVAKGSACSEVSSSTCAIQFEPNYKSMKAEILKLQGGGILIVVERTDNAKQLAAIYTAADLFLNLTYEDNYPTVNLEAEACGTPCFTYDTGGCSETICMSESGCFQTYASLKNNLHHLLSKLNYSKI